ncbi:type III secretion system stator protein SctL [Burkholderia ubonensis]|uniref:Flagellar assembly protein FliH n=1 Tax=Burkholderia ubonensis TaxID=101571 RepID=A0A108EDG7_9BURK|nr:type III secretion system stator protein SctL [Burkholderia ubonensis]KWD82854.1 type III secretion system protein [Burkholderia ubonensis]KWD87964.1 type III secretion system protein [Burkholderia ubonensis]KWD98491.1 type III secretion system protein [Burkholderia ubonensis]KWE11826.1 type III secretion system protein [Burkholderia ubonensis]KWN09330.1 type III secretion system protein [Burkholderia ubonensis]
MAFWLKNRRIPLADDLCIDAPHGVLRRDAFETVEALDAALDALAAERDAVLRAARDDAERIAADARTRADALVSAAQREHDSAYARGYDAGRAQAIADWHAQAADSFEQERRVRDRMRERLAELVAAAVQQMVRAEDARGLFARAAETVERVVAGASYLTVRVCDADYDAAREQFGLLADAWRRQGRNVPVDVVVEPRVARGTCVCESDFGTVDASLDTQLNAIRAALARALDDASRP